MDGWQIFFENFFEELFRGVKLNKWWILAIIGLVLISLGLVLVASS